MAGDTMQDGTYIVIGDKYIDKPYDNSCSIKDFVEENYDKLKSYQVVRRIEVDQKQSNTMTVEELIEELKTVNPKAKVVVNWLDDDGYYCENAVKIVVNDEGDRVVIGESPL